MGNWTLLNAAQIASVPTFVQEACITALHTDYAPMAETYARRREYVFERLTAMGLPLPEAGGAFYAFPDISAFGLDDDTFCRRMIREAGWPPCREAASACRGICGLSCCCSREDLTEGLDRMERFVKKPVKVREN